MLSLTLTGYLTVAVLLLGSSLIQGGKFLESLLFAVLWPATLAYLIFTSSK